MKEGSGDIHLWLAPRGQNPNIDLGHRFRFCNFALGSAWKILTCEILYIKEKAFLEKRKQFMDFGCCWMVFSMVFSYHSPALKSLVSYRKTKGF